MEAPALIGRFWEEEVAKVEHGGLAFHKFVTTKNVPRNKKWYIVNLSKQINVNYNPKSALPCEMIRLHRETYHSLNASSRHIHLINTMMEL
jgi:hypothetical protein